MLSIINYEGTEKVFSTLAGIIECPECEVPLVYELSEEPDIKTSVSYVEYQEILYTHNQGDIAVIKSILDSAGIIYYLKGERTSVKNKKVH